MQTSKIGLACAGGVVEGAFYEIGALCALDEAIDGLALNALDAYVGVSSGALLASCLANGVEPAMLGRGVLGLAEDPTLNVAPSVLFTPALQEYLGRVGRVPEVVQAALRRFWAQPSDLGVMAFLKELEPLLPVGMFSNEPLERFLRTALSQPGRTNDFRALDRHLGVVAVHLDTAELVCFGEGEMAHVPISKAVQASTALPGLYCPVEIDGQHYIDGVARRTVHASQVLNTGVDLLLCINPIVPVQLGAPETPEADHLVDKGLTAVLSQTFRTLVYSRMRTGFRRYAHDYPEADLICIEPRLDDQEVFFTNIFSFSNRRAVCEHAYAATRQYLRDHAETLAPMLARHGLRLDVEHLSAAHTLYESLPQRGTALAYQAQSTLARLDALLDRVGTATA